MIVAGLGFVAFLTVLASFAVPAIVGLARAFVTGASSPIGSPAPTGAWLSPFARLAADGRVLRALRFTVVEAGLSAFLALAVGLPGAWLVARRDFPGRRFLLSLSGVPLCVPPAIVALAFVLFFGRSGVVNDALMRAFDLREPPIVALYSIVGIVVAHGFYNFPVALRTISRAWERVPREESEAALVLGATRFRAFLTVVLPRLAGAIFSSAALVYLYCFFSFVIILLLGGPGGTTLEVELYQAARSDLDFARAGLIALVEVAAAVPVVLLYAASQARARSEIGPAALPRPRAQLAGAAERVCAAGYLFLVGVFLVGPLASVVVRSFARADGAGLSLAAWGRFLSRPSFLPAFATTCLVGVSSAILSTAAGFFLVAIGALSPPRARAAIARPFADRAVPLLPLAISSVILGFGWTLLVPRGNVFVLVLAQSALAWPFSWAQARAAIDRVPRPVIEAALVCSRGKADAAIRVLLPATMRSLLSGAALVFAISAGEASLPLVLSIDGLETLSLLLFRLAGSYRFAEASAAATVVALLSASVFLFQDVERERSVS